MNSCVLRKIGFTLPTFTTTALQPQSRTNLCVGSLEAFSSVPVKSQGAQIVPRNPGHRTKNHRNISWIQFTACTSIKLTLSPTSWPNCLINCLTWSSLPAMSSSWWWASRINEIQSTTWLKSGLLASEVSSFAHLQVLRSSAKYCKSLIVDCVVIFLLRWLRRTTSECERDRRISNIFDSLSPSIRLISSEKFRRSASHFSGRSLTEDKRRQIPFISLSSFKSGSNSSKMRLLLAFDSHRVFDSLVVSTWRNFNGLGFGDVGTASPQPTTSGFAFVSLHQGKIKIFTTLTKTWCHKKITSDVFAIYQVAQQRRLKNVGYYDLRTHQ